VFLELADKTAWIQLGYCKSFQKFGEFQDNAERINESDVTTEEFVEKYEKPYKPVIIQGVQNGWRAQHKWTIEVSYCNFNMIRKKDLYSQLLHSKVILSGFDYRS